MNNDIYLEKFICNEKYLDFNDVLMLPYSSSLNSRSQVDLEKTIQFKNSSWTGIPIIAANMTTTGTFEIYDILSKFKIITAFHKFYTLQDFQNYKTSNPNLNPDFFMVSTGISDKDYENLSNIVDNINCRFICIDIANGYIEDLKKFCIKLREKYPEHILIAGNVCT